MKKWDIPQISNLSVENTQSGDIIATNMSMRSDMGSGDKWRWECKCCGAVGPYEHDTESAAITAGKSEHGDPCPNRTPDGACPIS